MSQNSTSKSLVSVVVASSVGTMIEWYDFYIFGSLSTIIATKFFPSQNQTLALLSTLATFAAGFVVRPFGALIFGRLGDLVGRKYTFMITLLIMGGSTFSIGCIPNYDHIGLLAPLIVLMLRLLQGLALGGEYGGAATYVAEHSPSNKRGFWTSWIQTTATVGLFISLFVIYMTRKIVGKEAFEDYGWRIPFLVSIFMVIISYYIRKGMHESPLFTKIKTDGKIAINPLKESFGNKYNLKFVLLALLGVTMGQGVIWYTGQFYALNFIKNTALVNPDQAESIITWGLIYSVPLFIFFGALSDKIGRKWIMLVGMLLSVIFYTAVFEKIYMTVSLDNKHEIREKTIHTITKTTVESNNKGIIKDSICTVKIHKEFTDGTIYDGTKTFKILANQVISKENPIIKESKIINDKDKSTLILMVFILMVCVTMTYGPIAAYLVELFPTKIRYTSMSLPYHIGNGIFGGLLPAIATALTLNGKIVFSKIADQNSIIESNSNYLAGLKYPAVIAFISFVIGAIYLKETLNNERTQ